MHCSHHVKRDADARQRLGAKARLGQIRIDDDVGRGQLRSGQMVVGDENIDAERARSAHARKTRDAVVDRDEQRRRSLGRKRHDLRCQAIAELEAVRHQKIHRRKTAGAQRAHDQRRARRTIGVVIADHEDASRPMLQQQRHGGFDALERAHRQQPLEPTPQLLRLLNAARRIGTSEHRRAARERSNPFGSHFPSQHAQAHATPSASAASTSRVGRQKRH